MVPSPSPSPHHDPNTKPSSLLSPPTPRDPNTKSSSSSSSSPPPPTPMSSSQKCGDIPSSPSSPSSTTTTTTTTTTQRRPKITYKKLYKTMKRSRRKRKTTTTLISSSHPDNNTTTTTTPTHHNILILDSGGWNLKYGTLTLPSSPSTTTTPSPPSPNNNPHVIPNLTAKLRHQIMTLVADDIHSVKNKSQLDVTFPLERGFGTDWKCQYDVWHRVCEREGWRVMMRRPSNGGGIATGRSSLTTTAVVTKGATTTTSSSAVVILTQPFTPSVIMDRMDEVLFLDLGFGTVAKRMVQCCAAWRYVYGEGGGGGGEIGTTTPPRKRPPRGRDGTGCCLVVDVGFSMTHVVPTVDAMAISSGIRRLNIGGKLLTNYLKETLTYRQINLADEFFLVNDAKERLCYVSRHLHDDLNYAAKEKYRRYFDREFVLPDFVNYFEGVVRLPKYLMGVVTNDDDDDDDAAATSPHDNDNNSTPSPNDTRQTLTLSVERFATPEALFHPSDVGLADRQGLVAAIASSIDACDDEYRAALYGNVLLTGGSSRLMGLRERVERELRLLAPVEYEVRVTTAGTKGEEGGGTTDDGDGREDDCVEYAWKGARDWVRYDTAVGMWDRWCVDRDEWDENRQEMATRMKEHTFSKNNDGDDDVMSQEETEEEEEEMVVVDDDREDEEQQQEDVEDSQSNGNNNNDDCNDARMTLIKSLWREVSDRVSPNGFAVI